VALEASFGSFAEEEDDIGLNGPVDKLPGDNPVYKVSRIVRRRLQ
jgi:hypothetical protein